MPRRKPKRYTINFYGRIGREIRAEVRRVISGFDRVSGIQDTDWIYFDVFASQVIRTDDRVGFVWGVIYYPLQQHQRKRYCVAVAAGVHPYDGRRRWLDLGHVSNKRCVGQTLLHELAHYEQHRAGREPTERGVNVRARSLYRQIDRLEEE